jgi:hypothetical protein
MVRKSEQEHRGRIDHRWDRALDRAALRLGALWLLSLLLALLRLFGLLADRSPDGLACGRRGAAECRQCDCTDDEPPLHAANVTTSPMNGQ